MPQHEKDSMQSLHVLHEREKVFSWKSGVFTVENSTFEVNCMPVSLMSCILDFVRSPLLN